LVLPDWFARFGQLARNGRRRCPIFIQTKLTFQQRHDSRGPTDKHHPSGLPFNRSPFPEHADKTINGPSGFPCPSNRPNVFSNAPVPDSQHQIEVWRALESCGTADFSAPPGGGGFPGGVDSTYGANLAFAAFSGPLLRTNKRSRHRFIRSPARPVSVAARDGTNMGHIRLAIAVSCGRRSGPRPSTGPLFGHPSGSRISFRLSAANPPDDGGVAMEIGGRQF